MSYNKELLKKWCQVDEEEEYFEQCECSREDASDDKEYDRFCAEHEQELETRIRYCEDLLRDHKDVLIFYTLAVLYDQLSVERSADDLYKRKVRYYSCKALRRNPAVGRAWLILAQAYDWIAMFGGDDKSDVMPSLDFDEPEEERPGDLHATYAIRFTIGKTVDDKRQAWLIRRARQCFVKAIKYAPDDRKVKHCKKLWSM
jgi:hypothetical protein